MTFPRQCVVFILLLFCTGGQGGAEVIRVPDDQPSISHAMAEAVDGDTVLVADGLWMGIWNRNLDFQGRVITVRSENGPENCTIDGGNADPGFVFVSGEGPESVVEGFTLSHFYYGAVSCEDSSPTIRGCTFTGNPGYSVVCENSLPLISGNTFVDTGGGIILEYGSSARIEDNTITGCEGRAIHCYRSSPTIVNNLISGNDGGISCNEGCSPLIMGNTITGNTTAGSGGGIYCFPDQGGPKIIGNIISGNEAAEKGGGIYIWWMTNVVVRDNLIADNIAGDIGGGLYIHQTDAVISRNTFSGNHAEEGGGVWAGYERLTFRGNRFINNDAAERGGGLRLNRGTITMIGNLVAGNTSLRGGALSLNSDAYPVIVNGTITGNSATYGSAIHGPISSAPVIANSIIWANSGTPIECGSVANPPLISYSNVEGGFKGEGNIDADPMFVTGPEGDHYLSQTAAGQPADSPCVDAGTAGHPVIGSTRTDGIMDGGLPDMGSHIAATALLACPGPGPTNSPRVRLFPAVDDASPIIDLAPYGGQAWGANVTAGNLDGDGMTDIITGAGPGEIYGPHVRGFVGDGTTLPGLNYLAYGTNKYGVNVSAGDLDGDGIDEIITGAGPGAVFGPHVRGWVYDGSSAVSAMPGVNFFAYGTPKWGVNVAAGDIDGDGFDEIVTGAGPGAVYGPHVRGWNVDGGAASAISAASFMAYGTNQFGVNVTAGDVDGDGIDEIVTGAGPGAVFGPHVRGWNYDGSDISALPGYSFFAWDDDVRLGVNVFAGADLNGDSRDELVAGRGPDPTADTEVKVFTYDGAAVSQWMALEAYPGMTYGTNVAAGRF